MVVSSSIADASTTISVSLAASPPTAGASRTVIADSSVVSGPTAGAIRVSSFAAGFLALPEARPAARVVLVRLFFALALTSATASVGASSNGSAIGLRRPADATPCRGSTSVRLTEITRASSAPLFFVEEVRRRFDEDSMPAIFVKQRGMATFLLAGGETPMHVTVLR